ncbi:c57443db-2dbf-4044-aee1-e3f777ec7e64 [Thermothielavioides terrestris]|nr:c57443db-2dbf-4044-aee1-e3f777ec7e64 [Thermothielavioides terrestris]
MDPRLL